MTVGLTDAGGTGDLTLGRGMISDMSWNLVLEPATNRGDLLAVPVAKALTSWPRSADPDAAVLAAPIDPALADTAAFCDAYGVPPEESANCVIVAGKRDGEVRYAACLVLATTRADVNGVARRRLGVRKASFAAMDIAVELTGMEYGGITPIGLPQQWPILIDPAVVALPRVVVGSGIRGSKVALPGNLLATLPHAEVLEGLGQFATPRA